MISTITFASGPARHTQTDATSRSDPDTILTCVIVWHEQIIWRLCACARNTRVQQCDTLQASGVSWVHRRVALDRVNMGQTTTMPGSEFLDLLVTTSSGPSPPCPPYKSLQNKKSKFMACKSSLERLQVYSLLNSCKWWKKSTESRKLVFNNLFYRSASGKEGDARSRQAIASRMKAQLEVVDDSSDGLDACAARLPRIEAAELAPLHHVHTASVVGLLIQHPPGQKGRVT